MERFDDGLKTRPIGGAQKLVAIVENTPVTSVPMVTIAEKAAIETKKATIAYSITVAPFWSSFIPPSLERIAGRPAILGAQ